MSLLNIRKDFIEFSGREDLVTDTVAYADNGADKFIRAGQRWLDRTFTIGKQEARLFSTLAIGDWYSLLTSCRAVHEVWMSNLTNGKWKLDRVDISELRRCVGDDPGSIDAGQSLTYSTASLRSIPEVVGTITIDKFGSVVYSTTGNHYTFNGLVWLPPIDAITTLEVQGNFYQPILTNNTDLNYWSEEEPFVLVLAACRALEISYRNNQGVSDWEAAISRELIGLEFDLADQESSEYHSMEGSYDT